MSTYTKGERVRVFGRPWGKSHAPPRWRYGTIAGTNLDGKGRRFPVATLSDLGADYTEEAYLIQFTPQGGALWYRLHELRKVNQRRAAVSTDIRTGTIPQGYALTDTDVGRPLTGPSEGFGRVLPGDVGRRVYLRAHGFVMENAEQRDARTRPAPVDHPAAFVRDGRTYLPPGEE